MVVPNNYPAVDLKNTKVTWLCLIIIQLRFKKHEKDMVVLYNYPIVDFANAKVTWLCLITIELLIERTRR